MYEAWKEVKTRFEGYKEIFHNDSFKTESVIGFKSVKVKSNSIDYAANFTASW